MPLSGRRILFAEDVDADRELYRQVLKRAGAVVVAVESAEVAESVAGTVRFDAVVLDYLLPEAKGTEATVALRSTGFAGAVVGLTAYGNPELGELWRAAGCDEVVPKVSAAAGALVAAVAEACDRRIPRG